MYTEEEAKVKLCPVAFASMQRTACSGSLCMAWRHAPHIKVDGKLYDVGFCGLAGEPDQAFR